MLKKSRGSAASNYSEVLEDEIEKNNIKCGDMRSLGDFGDFFFLEVA